MQCDLCARICADHLISVPDRAALDPPYGVESYCLLCLDAFLSLFPLHPSDVRTRETIGRWGKKRRLGTTVPLTTLRTFTCLPRPG